MLHYKQTGACLKQNLKQKAKNSLLFSMKSKEAPSLARLVILTKDGALKI